MTHFIPLDIVRMIQDLEIDVILDRSCVNGSAYQLGFDLNIGDGLTAKLASGAMEILRWRLVCKAFKNRLPQLYDACMVAAMYGTCRHSWLEDVCIRCGHTRMYKKWDAAEMFGYTGVPTFDRDVRFISASLPERLRGMAQRVGDTISFGWISSYARDEPVVAEGLEYALSVLGRISVPLVMRLYSVVFSDKRKYVCANLPYEDGVMGSEEDQPYDYKVMHLDNDWVVYAIVVPPRIALYTAFEDVKPDGSVWHKKTHLVRSYGEDGGRKVSIGWKGLMMGRQMGSQVRYIAAHRSVAHRVFERADCTMVEVTFESLIMDHI